MKELIIITGPTASGKTDFALQLGTRMPIEIINGDMGQLYTPLTIGTAKPAWQIEPIPHHLFDYLSNPENFTVTEYRNVVTTLIAQIHSRGNIPVIVGGSLFYIRSLFFPPRDTPLKNTETVTGTWDDLYAIDPKRATMIDRNDQYRINRALTLWHQTGILPSTYQPLYDPVYLPCRIIYCRQKRSILYSRINQRTIHMIKNGWVEEVRQLPKAWREFLKIKKIIGYPEIDTYLTNGGELSSLITDIQQKTRNYAKRQETAWRSFKEKIIGYKNIELIELDLTLSPVHLYIDQLLSIFMSNENDKKNT